MKRILTLVFALVTLFAMPSCNKTKKLAQNRNDLQDTYETLKRELPEANITYKDDKVKVILPEAVLFNVNSADIQSGYLASFTKIANVLNKYKKTSILITGFTDISGTKELNDKLSLERAENAKKILVENNVRDKRVYTWGFGSKNPIATNETEIGRKQNRRVEFVILYDYKSNN